MKPATSVLFAHLIDLEVPHHLAPALTTVTAATTESLIIVLFSNLFSSDALNRVHHWDDVQKLLTFVYVKTTKVAQDLGKVLLDITVLLKHTSESFSSDFFNDFDICFRIQSDPPILHIPHSIPQVFLIPDKIIQSSTTNIFKTVAPSLQSSYPVVALGGTFDHLHPGHKILLSMAAWIASSKVIIGITDDQLLRNKSNNHLLQSLPVRAERTRSFLRLLRPDLEYDIVPICDLYGPTAWDRNIQALVVSTETLPGAAAIDKKRAAVSLPPLRTFVIDVISSESEKLNHEDMQMLKQTKLSSTFIREWIAKNQVNSVE